MRITEASRRSGGVYRCRRRRGLHRRQFLFGTPAGLLVFSFMLIACDSQDKPENAGVQSGPDVRSEKDVRRLLKKAGRPRIKSRGIFRGAVDFTDGTIRYFTANAAELTEAAGSGGSIGGGGELQVVDWGPREDVPVENRRPNIYVMFNRPAVPLARLGSPITELPYFTVEPPVEGTFRWLGTRTLGFRPDKPLLDAPRYRISLSAEAAGLSGLPLTEDFSFDIFGERMKIVNMYPGSPETNPENNYSLYDDIQYDVPTALAKEITLEFNQPVDIASIARFIRVYIDEESSEESSGEQGLSFRASRPEYPGVLESRSRRALLVTLDDEPPEETGITIVLNKGAAPFDGYPQTALEESYYLRTGRAFEAERLRAYAGSFPRDNRAALFPVYLGYSHALDSRQSTAGFTLWVDGAAVEPEEIALSRSSVIFYLRGVRPGMKIAVEAPPTVSDRYGRRAEAGVWETIVPRPSPLVDFPSRGWIPYLQHLEAEFEPALVWVSRNLVEGRLGRAGRPNYFDNPNFKPPPQEINFRALPKDAVYFHREELAPMLSPSGRGTVFFDYEFRKDPGLQTETRWQWERGRTAVQVTDLGLSVRASYNAVLIWVNRLSDGSAVPNAQVKAFNLRGTEYTGSTGPDGLAVLPIPPGTFTNHFSNEYVYMEDLHVRAEKDGDLAEMRVEGTHDSQSHGVYGSVDPGMAEQTRNRIYMFTDRGLYKGGEELALRGIHWLQDTEGFTPADTRYSIRISEYSGGNIVWEGSGRVSESGGFSHRLTLPEDLEPGRYWISYHDAEDEEGFKSGISFRIASFRRVNFQVISEVRGRDSFRGDTLEASVQALNLAGGPLPAAEYSWYWMREPFGFVPPGPRWRDWRFGTSLRGEQEELSSGEGRLSGAGTALISESAVDHEVSGSAYRYTLETTVEDIDRQAVSALARAVVHPADYYLGVRLGQGSTDGWWSRFVSAGDEFTAEVRLVDIHGGEVNLNAPVTMGLIKGEWQSGAVQGLYGRTDERWEYVEEEIRREERRIKRGSSKINLTIKEPGEYTLYFEYTDSEGRTARTDVDLYASGSGWVRRSGQTPREIKLVVDKDVYEPGETARILVQSPIEKGRYLLTLERGGILEERVIELEGSTEMIEVDVKKDYVPVFYAALSSFTERTETEDDYFEPDVGRPRSLFGLTAVRVSTKPVELDVKVESGKASYGPGDEVEILVSVEHGGEPAVGAEVTLLGVDRGVLDLIDYRVPNALSYFYGEDNFPHGVTGDDSRRLLLRPVTYDTAALQPKPEGEGEPMYSMAHGEVGDSWRANLDEGGDGEGLDERRDFNPLAFFEPALITNAEGKVRFRAVLPDTLTAYRVTAAAVEGVKLGLGEGEFQVSNPVNVRTALPRRFRSRDTAAAGVILNNVSDEDVKVSVEVESDILNAAGKSIKRVKLRAGGAAELPFILEAVEKGEGVIRFTVRSESLSEVLEERVVVEAAAAAEAFSTVGAAGGAEAEESVVLPGYSAEGGGALTLSLDASLRPYIDGALDRLLNAEYPLLVDELYEAAARAAVFGGGRGAEVGAGGRAELEELEVRAADIFERLAAFQFDNGGIGYRSPKLEYAGADWFLSILSAHAALELDEAGLGGAAKALNLDDLRGWIGGRLAEAEREGDGSFLAAWSAWVLARSGVIGRDELRWLADSGDRLGIAGYGLVSEACALLGDRQKSAALYRRARNFITLGTRSVDVAETAERADYFAGPQIQLAALMRAAVLQDEEPEFVMRLAGSLDDRRNKRRFSSRFDDFWTVNGFAPLLREEKSGSAQRVTVNLGGRTLITEPSPGAELPDSGGPLSLRRSFPLIAPPLSQLEVETPLPLTISTDGKDPLYYSAALSYALPAETALHRDEGIEVFSRIETLTGEELSPDQLPLGETLRVRVNINTLNRRSFLRLVVPIPSGAEIVDPSLAVSGRYLNAGGTDSETWTRETVYGDTVDVIGEGYAQFSPAGWRFWFYRPIQTVYDNAAAYLWEDFHAGQREISFLIRTTTPGIYPTPPVSVSLQFEPEVFGRSAGTLFIIKAAE